ncbi:hypothetical protein [Pedobacter punctiformis]|uniref:Uncharacterized protein n=1 Tax=Pedobacter punctiformis TaxID=3004097 RepID=A0ABT4LDY0_9SPHI|nr:hypothetical protein [Pedobacter sp. HCMS5-2]MCZ4245054.1 hypothetical protein [Pedobacter sp. HCMS5-2]
MNFDQLKNDWNKPETEETEILQSMLHIKEAHTPIDKIRKQMKCEFFVQLASLLFIALTPRIFGFPPEIKPVFMAFYAVTCGFCAYYFFKFYVFYKHSYDLSLDTRKNLLWFYYEMKLNIELYKALTYILAFIVLSFAAVYLLMVRGTIFQHILDKVSMIYIILNCFITILIVGLITELWAKFYYGKYVKELKKIIDKLDDE